MIVHEKPAEYRGTIEVYEDVKSKPGPGRGISSVAEWRWRCKSRNNTILASGEGYKRRAGALNAIDAQYAVKLTGNGLELDASTGVFNLPGPKTLVVPWRLVIHDRHGNIERIGAVY
ncbi:YegP family protein [Gordonia rubripertincta]|uniref:YegP family protein n=1 Tax=Gordonia rubripertincta TaxID=36822 RepID=UPI0015FE0BA4|nr:YegP family protein [Gordonia rubripertincta]QMU19322.1 YegP family protein [Gordonia rubripertincta]